MGSNRPRLLFLSHSGVDREAAEALVRRIEEAPEAREQGLRVWFDHRDLPAGLGWQSQIEEVIEGSSTAFGVYVGSRGVLNWVDREVRLAISRATRDPSYRVIPIVSGGIDAQSLPPLLRLHHAVHDVEREADEFAKLLRAALGNPAVMSIRAVEQPFIGLRSYRADDAHLFFGRERETDDLIERLKRVNLVMVVGDSGSGKSSLVRAGVIPRFRGGALRDPHAIGPDDRVWHVVETRPRGNPFEALADDLAQVARNIGWGAEALDHLRRRVRSREPESVRDALVDGSPAGTQILLAIDQFEELWTGCEVSERVAFVRALLFATHTERASPIRVVLTMRRDYYNLCSEIDPLYSLLEARSPEGSTPAKYVLRRIDDDGLRRCITEPLKLAGAPPNGGLVAHVLGDLGDEPGDVTLIQVALSEAWRRRDRFRGDMLEAYASLHGVAGALATLAEEVFLNRLDDDERRRTENILIRLVRLGTPRGTTRQIAERSDFAARDWSLVQKLASAGASRLLAIGGEEGVETVELSHEALVTQWPRYQSWLHDAAADKQIHDSVIPRASRWRRRRDAGLLLTGNELIDAVSLTKRRPEWLSSDEDSFIAASIAARSSRDRREMLLRRAASASTLVSLVLLIALFTYYYRMRDAEGRAAEQRGRLAWTSGVAARDRGDAVTAAHYFARAADLDTQDLSWENAALAADNALGKQRLIGILDHGAPIKGAWFDKEERRVLTWSDDGTVRLWDTATQQPIGQPIRHGGPLIGATVDQAQQRILTLGQEGTVRLWDAGSQQPLGSPLKDGSVIFAAVFDKAERHLLTAGKDGMLRLWDVSTGLPVGLGMKHPAEITSAMFDAEERWILTCSGDGVVRLWDAATQQTVGSPITDPGVIGGATFDSKGKRILTSSNDGTLRLWDLATQQSIGAPMFDSGVIDGAKFDREGNRILSESKDGTLRLWDAATQLPIGLPMKGVDGEVYADFDATERRILARGEKAVRLWDAFTQLPIGAPIETGDYLYGAAFDQHERRILTWDAEGLVRVWDVATQQQLGFSMRHDDVNGATFDREGGRILTWGNDGTVRMWSAPAVDSVSPLNNGGHIEGAIFDRDDRRFLTWGRLGRSVRLWDADAQKPIGPAMDTAAVGAVFDREERRVLTWSTDGIVRLWDGATQQPIGPAMAHNAHVYGATFDREEHRILSWSADKTVRLWDAGTQQPIGSPLVHGESVSGATFDRAEHRILSWTYDGSVLLWDVATQQTIGVPIKHGNRVSGATFDRAETRILTWSDDGTIRLWEATTHQPIGSTMVQADYSGSVNEATFDRDERRILASGTGGTVRLWDPATQRLIGTPMKQDGTVFGARFDREQHRILAWGDTVRLWDAATQVPIGPAITTTPYISEAALDREERRILTSGRDGTVRLWDVATRQLVIPPLNHAGGKEYVGAIFDHRERRILTWNSGGLLRLVPNVPDRAWPQGSWVVGVEVDSGTHLLPSGEVQAMSPTEWRTRKRRLGETVVTDAGAMR